MAAVGAPAGQGPYPLPAWAKDRPLTGPFISGSTHAVLVFGQDPSEEGDARGGQSARRSGALKTRSSGAPAGSDTTGAGPRTWPVSLSDLIAGGLLTPGPDALSVTYKSSTHTAELRPDGAIMHEGRAFGSASAFSIHVKRLITPDKQGDDGWKSVLYQGKPLDVYRRQLRETLSEAIESESEAGNSGGEDEEEGPTSEMTSPRVAAATSAAASTGPGPAASDAGGTGPTTPASTRQGADGASSARPPRTGARKSGGARASAGGQASGAASRLATMSRAPRASSGATASRGRGGREAKDQDLAWVQCDGCGTWRVVPDHEIATRLADAGDDATWHCRDASWDVKAVPPHTPPCKS